MILGRKRKKDAEIGELLEFRFSPGYCDMAGGHHYENLHRDETGQWVIVSRNRNVFSDPASVMTYAVSEEAVREFVSFIAEKKVLELEDRKDSDLFITDYSPWSFTFVFSNPSEKSLRTKICTLAEYKMYSDEDRRLIDELEQRFLAMRGEIISETTEEDS